MHRALLIEGGYEMDPVEYTRESYCLTVNKILGTSMPWPTETYWQRRTSLFTKWDGQTPPLIDTVGWYSVTPERLANGIAKLFRDAGVVAALDPFAGLAGNVIANAKFMTSIGCEIDPIRVKCCRSNIALYKSAGIVHETDGYAYINTFAKEHRKQKLGIFLSPPWGGTAYERKHFALDEMQIMSGAETILGSQIVKESLRVTKNVFGYFPVSTDVNELNGLVAHKPKIQYLKRVGCEYYVTDSRDDRSNVLIAMWGDLKKHKLETY